VSKSKQSSQPHDQPSSTLDVKASEGRVAHSIPQTLRALPARFFTDVEFPSLSGPDIVAFVSLSLAKGSRLDPERLTRGQLRRLSPPVDPSRTNASGPTQPDATPRNLNLASDGKDKGEEEKPTGSPLSRDVLVGVHPSIPFNHIIFSALPEGVEEWDIVRSGCFRHETLR